MVIDSFGGMYDEFCLVFFYVEMDDQFNVLDDVLGDFIKGWFMDCLICGDVGFGKMEVVLWVVFVVVMSGQQVVVVVLIILLV